MPISHGPADSERASVLTPPERSLGSALMRGGACRCPACGVGSLYRSYLKVVDACGHCGEVLSHQRADDAPAYFTMAIVGHVVIGGLLALERAYAPPTWVHMSIWLPLTLILSLALLPVIKGALVGLQWAYRMHGFGGGLDPAAPAPDPAISVAGSRKGQ